MPLIKLHAAFSRIIAANGLAETVLKIQPAKFPVSDHGQADLLLKLNGFADFCSLAFAKLLEINFFLVIILMGALQRWRAQKTSHNIVSYLCKLLHGKGSSSFDRTVSDAVWQHNCGNTRRGSWAVLFLRISKCRCGPVTLPVLPTLATVSPRETDCPCFTRLISL